MVLHGSLCIDFEDACLSTVQDTFRQQFREFVDLVDNPNQSSHSICVNKE